ncbi:hypothetical protein [Streptomyces olivaceus]|uniref:hypothetical protein n=1 Tax=Streptomyces olivaceus TaxID=47716 RepID=UPI00405602E8
MSGVRYICSIIPAVRTSMVCRTPSPLTVTLPSSCRTTSGEPAGGTSTCVSTCSGVPFGIRLSTTITSACRALHICTTCRSAGR